jgi:hypothetical protein
MYVRDGSRLIHAKGGDFGELAGLCVGIWVGGVWKLKKKILNAVTGVTCVYSYSDWTPHSVTGVTRGYSFSDWVIKLEKPT